MQCFTYTETSKRVEISRNKLTEFLRYGFDQLKPEQLDQALIAAILNDNHAIIGELIIKRVNKLEGYIKLAIVERKAHSRAILLLVKAALMGRKSIIQKLFGDSVSNPSSLDLREFNDDQFVEVQQAVLSGKVSTVIPIKIARKYNNHQVCEELLQRTGVNEEEGSVFWHGLQLLSLDISWLRGISWVKLLTLTRNGFKSLPQEMGTYLKQVSE